MDDQPLSPLEPLADRTVVNARVFPYPPALLFKAWTEADHLSRWWGPDGFRNTFHRFEPEPGGRWSFIMHGPDGTDYANESVFVALEEPTRVVLNHLSAPKFQVNASFDAQEEGTLLTFCMIFPTSELYAKLRDFVQPKNEENFDRLEVELQRMTR